MLGVVNRDHPTPDDAFPPDIPNNAAKLLTPKNDTVWGNFYVCPAAPERAGWMRFVIVKEAARLVVGRK